MRVTHRMMITVTLIGTILASRASSARAQNDPPDLKMLLNLDLYGRSQTKGTPAAGPSGSQPSSMLDQIRTLRAMGYLGGGAKTAANASGSPTQETQPAGNVEVTPSQSDDQGAPQL